MPKAFENAYIVVKVILHFGSYSLAPFLGVLFAGVNVIELFADIADGTADTGKFVFIGVRISWLFRNLYMEHQMFEQIAIDKPILFLILKRVSCGILVIAEHDCLMLNTGIRTGEALGLMNSDIDIENRVMHVRRGVKEIYNRESIEATSGRSVNVGKLKSMSSKRDVPLNDTAIEMIKDLRK